MNSTFESHSSSVLRARIQAIIEERALNRSSIGETNLGNVVISHPPSPILLESINDHNGLMREGGSIGMCRRLSEIEPLDVNFIERVALSTPPSESNKSLYSSPNTTTMEENQIRSEVDYPLILVTGLVVSIILIDFRFNCADI